MKQFDKASLPKGRKWSDDGVITKKDPNLMQPKILFYPIGTDLYIKGLYIRYKRDTNKKEIITVVLHDYRNTTAAQINMEYDIPVLIQSMICIVWRELGLRQGFVASMFAPA